MYNFSDLTHMKRACIELFESETNKFDDTANEDIDVILSDTQIDALSENISALPNDYQEALFARLCFGFSTEEVSKIFEIADPKKSFAGAQLVLAYSVPLESGKRISMESLKKACDKALSSYVSTIKAETKKRLDCGKRSTLKGFMRRQRKKPFAAVLLKYAAVFFIGVILCATVTLTASAELRERFFSWVISTYEKYSSFGITAVDEDSIVVNDISRLQISLEYIPEGFVLSESEVGQTRKRVRYLDSSDKRISVTVLLPGAEDKLNTEDAELETILVNGHEGKRWEKNKTEFIVWEQEGCMLTLITDLEQETALKIAENIHIVKINI